MEQIFNSNDVLASEIDELLGDEKITVTYKDKDGKEITVRYEF